MANKKQRELIRQRRVAFMEGLAENRKAKDEPKKADLSEEKKETTKSSAGTKKPSTAKKTVSSKARKTSARKTTKKK